MEQSREFCSRQHTVRGSLKNLCKHHTGMDGGKRESSESSTELSMHPIDCFIAIMSQGLSRPSAEGCHLLMWNCMWESTWSPRPAPAPILQLCEYGLLMTSSCLPSVVMTSTNGKLAYCWRWCPASKHKGLTSGHAWVIWKFITQAHSLVIYTLWLYLRSQACFGSFSMQFLSPSLSKGCPEGHFPQQILWTHVFTSGSAFLRSPDKHQLLAATASIYLLQPWRSWLFWCHSCRQHVTPGWSVCLSFGPDLVPSGGISPQTNPDSRQANLQRPHGEV